MIEKAAGHIAIKIYEKGYCSQEEIAWHKYGLQMIFGHCFTYGSMLALGAVFHLFIETLVYLGFYHLLRMRTDGYHAGSQLGCYTLSMLSLLAVLLGAPLLSMEIALVLMPLCFAAIVVLTPGYNPGAVFSARQKRRLRQLAIATFLAQAAAIIMAWQFPLLSGFAAFAASGVLVCTLFILASHIKKIKERKNT